MSLYAEWKLRIIEWKDELKNHFFKKLGTINMQGFVTTEQLNVMQAAMREFAPMITGTRWGRTWEYGWFRGEFCLPIEAKGKRIVVRPETSGKNLSDIGGESIVYIDKAIAGSIDEFHKEITISHDGEPGRKFEVILETYSWHGLVNRAAGPTPLDRFPSEPPALPFPKYEYTVSEGLSRIVGESTFGIWEEDVYQLWLDVQTLYEIRENIDSKSLRVMRIDESLKDFTKIVDFELPYDDFLSTVNECRTRIAPLLMCINGSTMPMMHLVGHAHIDVAWLWSLKETDRKCCRTFSNQLTLMKEYPEYKFFQSTPYLYRAIKKHYPALYCTIKKAAAEGQFVTDGGMWVEADTNLPSGESLIRQFLHGKQYFKQEFGTDSRICWLPDVFGYSGALPQILKGCGIDYFATTKLLATLNGGTPFPYNIFMWEGIDGTEVFSYLFDNYGASINPSEIIRLWNERIQLDGQCSRLYTFGHSDGGGGATRDDLEFARRLQDLEGVPCTKMSTPSDFFKDLENREMPNARYVGELYYTAHRGTYTSQSKVKLWNRKCEQILREVELWSCIAAIIEGYSFNHLILDEDWKKILLYQFHDVITGCSIKQVYELALADYTEVYNNAKGVLCDALNHFVNSDEKAITIFNSLSWTRNVLIKLPQGFSGAILSNSEFLQVQKTHDGIYTEVQIPSCGYVSVFNTNALYNQRDEDTSSTIVLENEYLRVSINEYGQIDGIFDKEQKTEFTEDICNCFRMYKDVPVAWDAWDIDPSYESMPIQLNEKAEIMMVEKGPLFTTLEIKRKLNHSFLTQIVRLRHNSRRIDFETQIDWNEHHKLLKVCFPMKIHANEAIHEIQFGHIARPNHRSRPFDNDRFEVCAHKWSAIVEGYKGVAVMNDCKYGISVIGGSLNLTLLRAPIAPDNTADVGLHKFTYSLYVWHGSLVESGLVQEAYDLNNPVIVMDGTSKAASLVELDSDCIVLETMKQAEDGSGDLIMRLYEVYRTSCSCTIKTSIPIVQVWVTDMLENRLENLDFVENCIQLQFRPFEIKTIRLKCKKDV